MSRFNIYLIKTMLCFCHVLVDLFHATVAPKFSTECINLPISQNASPSYPLAEKILLRDEQIRTAGITLNLLAYLNKMNKRKLFFQNE